MPLLSTVSADTLYTCYICPSYFLLILIGCCLFPSCQAGLRAVHDLGPEIRRAISGNIEGEDEETSDIFIEEPMHRVMLLTCYRNLKPIQPSIWNVHNAQYLIHENTTQQVPSILCACLFLYIM